MPKTILSIKVLILTAAVLLAGTLSNSAVAVPKGPTTVAVLDVQKAFSKLDEKADIEIAQKKGVERIQDGQRKRADEIKALEAQYKDLSGLPDNDPNKLSKQDELSMKMATLQAWLQVEQARLSRDMATQLEGVRMKMLEDVQAVAKANKIDIVLNIETTIQLPPTNGRQASVNIRHVLWSDDSLDITEDVVQRMNNQYKK